MDRVFTFKAMGGCELVMSLIAALESESGLKKLGESLCKKILMKQASTSVISFNIAGRVKALHAGD